jgi:integrase
MSVKITFDGIIAAGRSFRSENGAEMRRRFQAGQLLRRGKRNPVWEARYWMPVLREGRFARVRRREILGTCAEMSKAKAQRALADVLRPINEGLYQPACASTFGELWRKWEEQVLCNYRESTRRFYSRTVIRWILPYFERWPMADISPLAVQMFVNRFSGYSRSVLRHVRASLSCVMRSGVDWGWIGHNPATALRLPPGNPVKRAAVLTPAELAKVIEKLEEPYRSMAVIAAHTGIRESEVLALEWADFDRERRVLSVRRSVYCGAVGNTKTDGSRREIPYGEAIADALERLQAAGHGKGDRLFMAPKGGYYSPQRITRLIFKPLAASLNLPAFSWRSFRRSAATAMHLGGIPLKVMQGILGHVSQEMSLTYADADLEAKRQAIEKFDALLLGRSGPNVGARVM